MGGNNPHFVFNTLNSLSALVLTDKTAAAEEMIQSIATFYGTSLTGDATVDLPLSDEIQLQRLFLDVEGVRFPARLRVAIDLPGRALGEGARQSNRTGARRSGIRSGGGARPAHGHYGKLRLGRGERNSGASLGGHLRAMLEAVYGRADFARGGGNGLVGRGAPSAAERARSPYGTATLLAEAGTASTATSAAAAKVRVRVMARVLHRWMPTGGRRRTDRLDAPQGRRMRYSICYRRGSINGRVCRRTGKRDRRTTLGANATRVAPRCRTGASMLSRMMETADAQPTAPPATPYCLCF